MKIALGFIFIFLIVKLSAQESATKLVVSQYEFTQEKLVNLIQSHQPVSTIVNCINAISSDPFNYEQNLYDALSMAVYYGHENLLDAFATKISLNVSTPNGNTLLHYAASGNQPTIIKKLINSYKFDSNRADLQGNAAIHFAAVSGAVQTLPVLDKYGTNFSIRNKNGESALLIACRLGHLQMVKDLVNRYFINLQCQDNNGNNALHHAASAAPPTSDDVVNFLHSKNISVLLKNIKGETALHCAVLANNLVVIKRLIQINQRLKTMRNNNGVLPAHYAAALGNIQAYDQLAYPCKKESEVDHNKKNALHYAAYYGQTQMLIHLLANPSFDINKQGKDGRRPIEEALACKSVDAVNALLNNSRYTSDDITNLLPFACKYSNVENLINLLEKNHYVLPPKSASRKDILDIALECNKNDMVACLRQLPTCNTAFLLSRAIKCKNFELVRQLVDIEKVPLNTPDEVGMTPFHIGIQINDLELCKYLYYSGADLSYVTVHRDTVLHLAAKTQNPVMVTWLYSLGLFGLIHHVQQNNEGLTPLECVHETNIPLLEIIGAYIWQLNNKQCSYCKHKKHMHELTVYKKCAHVMCNHCDAICLDNQRCMACNTKPNLVPVA
ncbi:hypothetical protein Noda2021_02050 [Candidatus Dependentiae bacterium Noda2021]|nr:hypothetical protein Noda2021_02050 [Candidatus Dependentiae bacterium Noda2021]